MPWTECTRFEDTCAFWGEAGWEALSPHQSTVVTQRPCQQLSGRNAVRPGRNCGVSWDGMQQPQEVGLRAPGIWNRNLHPFLYHQSNL